MQVEQIATAAHNEASEVAHENHAFDSELMVSSVSEQASSVCSLEVTNKLSVSSDNSHCDHPESHYEGAKICPLGHRNLPDLKSTQMISIPRNRPDEFTLSWHNLDYVVESKWYKLATERKPILNGLSGSFRSGELSAVLGPSGAGKSTLIDCLLGKRHQGLSGKTQVKFSDSELEQERRKRRPLRIVTIPQEDHLLESLTVTETLMFASKIKNAHMSHETDPRNPQRKRPFDHFANVQRVIKQLNLGSCSSLRCAKLSGGQYKRVSIGQELLSRPDVMILDEPTSGLDSVTCFQTVSALRDLIDSSPYPMAIVATIHQPDVEVFNLFHKAYVLASGGRAIYEGPTHMIFDTIQAGIQLVETKRQQSKWTSLTTNFATTSNNLDDLSVKLAERKCNPARLIVEVAANEYGFEMTSALNDIQTSDNNSSNSTPGLDLSLNREPTKTVSLQSLMTSNSTIGAPGFDYATNDPQGRKPNLDRLLCVVTSNVRQRRPMRVYMKHLLYHTQRSWVTITRDPMLFSLQVFLHILVPLLISYSYQGTSSDACPKIGPLDVVDEAYKEGNVLQDLNVELRAAFENLGYMFFQLYVIIFAAVCVTSLTYPLVMHVLLKEYRNGWYSMSSYFFGRTLADLPVPTLNVIIAMGISYHLTGQPLSAYGWRFISVAMLTVLATLVAQTQGLMFGAMLMNAPQSAVFVAPASTAPLVVVSGFLFRIQTLPKPLQFLSQFSYFTHLLNGFIVSRYGFNRCQCDEFDFEINDAHKIPPQAEAVVNLWVESFGPDYPGINSTQINLVNKLVDTINMAKNFGYEISNCSQVKPFTMLDYKLEDFDLLVSFIALILMLLIYRWLTYVVLSWKINSSL